MSDIYCNDGYADDIRVAQAGGSQVPKYLRLYSNDYTPVLDESPGHFMECTTAGYAPIALSEAGWTDGSSGGHVVFTYPMQAFNFTAAVTVYGYYVTDAAATKVYWAGRFPAAPFTLPSVGGAITGSLELDGP